MPENKYIDFKHEELLELLIRKAGVTSGIWALNIGFKFQGTTFQEKYNVKNPGLVAAIESIGIIKLEDGHNADKLIALDAANMKEADIAK